MPWRLRARLIPGINDQRVRALRPPSTVWYRSLMSSITEIEAAIEKLPVQQVEELAGWLDGFRARNLTPSMAESWLAGARGAALSGLTTATVMSLSRGEE